MRGLAERSLLLLPLALLASCAPSADTSRRTPGADSKEAIYQRGHQLYGMMEFGRAEAELKRAAAIDSSYLDPVTDLASLYFDLGLREEGEKNPKRLENFRLSRDFFIRAEMLGARDATVYERLCELSVALDDDRGFLIYARKNAELFPHDRQYFNLGLAYFGVGDWQGVVKSQKAAAEKFNDSPYLGGYYRQLGRAYMKLDRDQTAERTFSSGVQAVDGRVAALKISNSRYKSTDDYRRLMDDKIGMLLLLKRLHTTYKAAEKLEQVERQLTEAGYPK